MQIRNESSLLIEDSFSYKLKKEKHFKLTIVFLK